jgi:hypothetical protein
MNQKKEGEKPKLTKLEIRKEIAQQTPMKFRGSLGNT